MESPMFMTFIIAIIFGFIIAYFLGTKRQIGFGWSFFFCAFLSPIGGFLVTMLSRKYYDANPNPSKSKKIWGWILVILFSLSLVGQLMAISTGNTNSMTFNSLSITIGFIGLGYYLIELGKGKNFNTEALTSKEE
jgi:MFS family permease